MDSFVQHFSDLGKMILQSKSSEYDYSFDLKISKQLFIQILKQDFSQLSSEFIMGFFYELDSICISMWDSFSLSEKDSVKRELIRLVSFIPTDLVCESISQLYGFIHEKSDKKWPEMIDIVFHSEPTVFLVNLFVELAPNMDNSFTPDFIEPSFRLMKYGLTQGSLLLQLHLIIIMVHLKKSFEFNFPQTHVELMWVSVFTINQLIPSKSSVLSDTLSDLYDSQPDLYNFLPSTIRNFMNSNSLDEILSVIPFVHILNSTYLKEYFLRLKIVLDKKLLSPTECIHCIELLSESPIDLISDESLQTILDSLENDFLSISSAIIFASFSPYFSLYISEDIFFGIISNYLVEHQHLRYIGMKSLNRISSLVEYLPFSIPSFLIKDLLVDTCDIEVFDTLDTMIKSRVFSTEEHVSLLVLTFERTPVHLYGRLFKSLRLLIKENPDDTTVEMIFDFGYLTLRNDISMQLNVHCISLLAKLANVSHNLVSSIVDELLLVVNILMNTLNQENPQFDNREWIIKVAVQALQTCARLDSTQTSQSARNWSDFISSIVFRSNSIDNKFHKSIAISFAEIVSIFNFEKYISPFIQIIQLWSSDSNSLNNSIQVGKSFKNHNTQTVVNIIQIFLPIVLQTASGKVFSSILGMLSQFIKRHSIDFSLIESIVGKMISRNHPALPPNINEYDDEDSELFSFYKIIAIKYKNISNVISDIVLDWFEFSHSSISPLILHCIRKLSMENLITNLPRVANLLKTSITTEQSIFDCICLDTLMMLLLKDHSLISIDDYIVRLLIYWEDSTKLRWKSSLGTAILQLCAMGAEMLAEELEDIIAEFPFQQDGGLINLACEALIIMMNSGETEWEALQPHIAKSFSDLFISDYDLKDELGISEKSIADMKLFLMVIQQQKPFILSEIGKIYNDTPRKKMRYEKLLTSILTN